MTKHRNRGSQIPPERTSGDVSAGEVLVHLTAPEIYGLAAPLQMLNKLGKTFPNCSL